MKQTLLDDLKSLHTRAIDASHGYEEALHDAEGHGLTSLFQDMILLHVRNADELAAALRAAGERPDASGSFMSTVHRTIMSVRAMFGGLGESVLSGLIDGERRNVAGYDDVLGETSVPAPVRAMLEVQRERIAAEITRMEVAKR
jgi:uncharacterized protein (TIGR02284 family)